MRLSKTAIFVGLLGLGSLAYGQGIVINEFAYDDIGTDDIEFVELFNAGGAAVDIGGWTLGGRDPTTTNVSITITAGTMLAPGAYYVIGNTGVLNVNQVAAAGFLENDNETIELTNTGGAVIDAVAYETNKGVAFAAPVAGQVGPGYWSNNQNTDIGAAPNLTLTTSVGRFVNGLDTNNNGRDFGLRPATPGTSNGPLVTSYSPSNVDALANGAAVSGLAGSFVGGRVIDPTVVDSNNLNAIPVSPQGGKAIIAWDPSGGGNGVTADGGMKGTASFDIYAYLDTADLPQNSNASGALFTGSEQTSFGLGGVDALMNLADVSGVVGVQQSANGNTGIMWYYEKTQLGGSEKLYLIDANDGGDGGTGGATPLDWAILATIDLASSPSAWHRLGISIDPLGNGVATFDGQTFNFTTIADFAGSFSVGYRENAQVGSVLVPSFLRPPTFDLVPEPATIGLLLLGGLPMLRRRRRA